MECTYCGAELEYEDSYGNRDYIAYGNRNGKSGDIYRCPNHEGFSTKELALTYLQIDEDELEQYLKDNGLEDWEEIVCDSSTHNVSGSFYTDKQGNLYEGYPC